MAPLDLKASIVSLLLLAVPTYCPERRLVLSVFVGLLPARSRGKTERPIPSRAALAVQLADKRIAAVCGTGLLIFFDVFNYETCRPAGPIFGISDGPSSRM